MDLVMVTWVDAGMKMGWQSALEAMEWAEDDDKFTVTSMGYLFGESDEYIVLISSVTSGNQVCNPLRIRKKNILYKDVLYATKAESD